MITAISLQVGVALHVVIMGISCSLRTILNRVPLKILLHYYNNKTKKYYYGFVLVVAYLQRNTTAEIRVCGWVDAAEVLSDGELDLEL